MNIRTTAILNLKGGVAKTTTAVNMAAILAKDYGSRVLLIDADSQCNTTEFFGADTEMHGTLSQILRLQEDRCEPVAFCGSCIQSTQYNNLDIIPGDESLMDLDLSKVELGKVNVNILRQFAVNAGFLI